MADSRTADPITQFAHWYDEARAKEPDVPDAMTLATVGADGAPSARMVLLKGFDARGFVFYTNTESRKGVELAHHPRAALVFHWKSLKRQVRIEGPVERVADEDADAYFASRGRGSQIGAWASAQSRELSSRFALERDVAKYTAKFGVGEIPRPPFWTGYRVAPHSIEFWRDMPFRLHERELFTRADDGWVSRRLQP